MEEEAEGAEGALPEALRPALITKIPWEFIEMTWLRYRKFLNKLKKDVLKYNKINIRIQQRKK